MWAYRSTHLCQHVRSTCRSAQPARFSSKHVPVLGVRRETINPWERRAPLAPHHVEKLVKKGYKVIVQPSNRRAYPMEMYTKAGAVVNDHLDECTVIMGVKSVPIEMLLPEKTYCFFSHTIKGQPENMPLLDAMLANDIRLLDYEKMVDQSGQRVVAFGKYAGVAGMIDILHGIGLRLLALGHHTPFLHIGLAHNYRSSAMARQAIRDAGYEISLGLMPKSIGPLTLVVTGSGNVSQGVQEVFQELPYEYIEPHHLPKVSKHGSRKKLYACIASREDHLVRTVGGGFCPEEYEQHPELYSSTFSKTIAPYASVIVNGIYWAPNSPKLLSIPDAKNLLQPSSLPWLPEGVGTPSLPHRLLAICDISADPGGSIEFMNECTTIEKPFCLYDADENKSTENFAGPGVLVCSIDNMPTQLPREATDFFGELLFPYVPEMLKSDASTAFSEYDVGPIVKNAVITSNGSLTSNFEYLTELRNSSRSRHKARSSVTTVKRVLVLGAGYVSAPLVEYLSRNANYHLTVASVLSTEVQQMASKFAGVTPCVVDVANDDEALSSLVQDHDLVISLLPYDMHGRVAKHCIRHQTNMVTSSYVTPEMRELEQEARDVGITIVNEVGLDPGIDHLLAMECIESVKEQGSTVKSFISYCGGLPAPENSENPLRYKFSWSPLGVFRNAHSGARYLLNGKVVDVPVGGAVLDARQNIDFLPGFNLEAIPNRDSTKYAVPYGIESAHTIIRGTLRYRGYCEALKGLLKVGLINDVPHPNLHPMGPEITWKEFMCTLLDQPLDMMLDMLKDAVFDNVKQDNIHYHTIANLGLLSDDVIEKKNTPLATVSHYMAKRLAYGANERDIIVLRHNIAVERADKETEVRHINLVVYGDPRGYSAMAKCVGYPTAIASKMLLEDEIQHKGIVIPLMPEIYRTMLKRLAYEGIVATETVSYPEYSPLHHGTPNNMSAHSNLFYQSAA